MGSIGTTPMPANSSPTKAPYAYYGGKSRMAAGIAALFPDHVNYIEAFLGSGAVFFAKRPNRGATILNDVDRNVVTFLRVLRDSPDELYEVCALTPHARDEFRLAADMDTPMTDLERARRFWVRINQSFAKTMSAQTGWSWTTARTTAIPATISNRRERFMPAAERLMGCTIENKPAVALLEGLTTGPESVWYLDPPYMHSTRVQTAGYAHEMTDADHEALARVCNATTSVVVISGYRSPEYDEWYAGWYSRTIETMGWSSNSKTNVRTPRHEVLWCNRDVFGHPEPQMSFDALV